MKMKKTMILLILLFAGSTVFGNYSGDSVHVWHVAKSGNDGNGGRAQQYPVDLAADAKLTVQAAINAASAGDTIIGHSGTYTENVALNKSLTLEGTHREKFRIESSTGDALTVSADGCTVRSLSAKTTHESSQGINCTGGAFGLKFFDVYGEGPYDGINLGTSFDVWLEECLFVSGFDTIQLGSGRNIMVLRCIAENTGDALTATGIIASGETIRLIDCIVRATSSRSDSTLNGIKISGVNASAVISGCNVSVQHSAEGGSEETIALSVATLAKVEVCGGVYRASGLAGTTRIIKAASRSVVSLNGCQVNYAPWTAATYYGVTAQVGGFEKTKFIDTSLPGVPDGTFDDWHIQWVTGNNAGVFSQVDTWTLIPKEIVLKAATPYDIEIADEYALFQKKSSTTTSLYNDDSTLRVADSHYDTVNTVGTILQGGSGWATAVLINARTAGYISGAVWIDTNASNENTVSYVDGTADNPVSTIAAATVIADNLNIKSFHLVAGSGITLAQAYDFYTFTGYGAIIALDGQSINGAIFFGIKINGNDDGSNTNRVRYFDCDLSNNDLGQFIACRARLTGTLTLAQAGTYFFDSCYSGVAGTSAPVLDFGSGLNASNVSMRHYSGGIEIKNMGAGSGSYNMSLEGDGQLIINANCSATSVVAIRGNFTVTDNAGGTVTLSDEARYDADKVRDSILDDATRFSGGDIEAMVSAGSGSVAVNHDTGGADNLAYKTGGGAGIDNATVRAYLKTDYDAGNLALIYVKGTAITDVNGQWSMDMQLDPDTYTFYFFRQPDYGPDIKEAVIS